MDKKPENNTGNEVSYDSWKLYLDGNISTQKRNKKKKKTIE